MDALPVLTDNAPGQDGRQYVYDLPTLDDPTVENSTDGIGEDNTGMDEAGPWGGNDGFNMAILPADAPLRIYADGLRNSYDLAFTAAGNLYAADNSANAGLGGEPLDANGRKTSALGADKRSAGYLTDLLSPLLDFFHEWCRGTRPNASRISVPCGSQGNSKSGAIAPLN